MDRSTLDGAIIFYFLIAAVMTLVIGTAALALLQRFILRHMAAIRGAPDGGVLAPDRLRKAPSTPLALMPEDPAAAPDTRVGRVACCSRSPLRMQLPALYSR
jgi:hypothetical protein